jgi:hypothetical protein
VVACVGCDCSKAELGVTIVTSSRSWQVRASPCGNLPRVVQPRPLMLSWVYLFWFLVVVALCPMPLAVCVWLADIRHFWFLITSFPLEPPSDSSLYHVYVPLPALLSPALPSSLIAALPVSLRYFSSSDPPSHCSYLTRADPTQYREAFQDSASAHTGEV